MLFLSVQVMLDTVGAELQVVNKSETPISLKEDAVVTLTPHQGQEASSEVLPINFGGLAKVQPHLLSLLFPLRRYMLVNCKYSVKFVERRR